MPLNYQTGIIIIIVWYLGKLLDKKISYKKHYLMNALDSRNWVVLMKKTLDFGSNLDLEIVPSNTIIITIILILLFFQKGRNIPPKPVTKLTLRKENSINWSRTNCGKFSRCRKVGRNGNRLLEINIFLLPCKALQLVSYKALYSRGIIVSGKWR